MSPPVLCVASAFMVKKAFLDKVGFKPWVSSGFAMLFGMILYPLISPIGNVDYNCRFPVAQNIVIGLLLGAAPTGFDDIWSRFTPKRARTKEDPPSST